MKRPPTPGSCAAALAALLAFAAGPASALAAEVRAPAAEAPPPATVTTTAPPVGEVVVSAPEPRYVAPTRRDRIGRVWAPVYINERGPFRLVLDTGASASAITAPVAEALGLSADSGRRVRMFGVTGVADVPAVHAELLRVGEIAMESVWLPIVADAFGGAEGVLGNHGLRAKRITIDFRADRIEIAKSRGQRASTGMITIPVELTNRGLLVIPTRVGGIPVKAIVDTGGQATIGNLALRAALERRDRMKDARPDEITGATLDVQPATRISSPPIGLGKATIRNASIAFGDMFIFDHWRMNDEPALLLGMDVLGLLDVLVIDYRRRELQILLRGAG